jgi:hypothetical protein
MNRSNNKTHRNHHRTGVAASSSSLDHPGGGKKEGSTKSSSSIEAVFERAKTGTDINNNGGVIMAEKEDESSAAATTTAPAVALQNDRAPTTVKKQEILSTPGIQPSTFQPQPQPKAEEKEQENVLPGFEPTTHQHQEQHSEATAALIEENELELQESYRRLHQAMCEAIEHEDECKSGSRFEPTPYQQIQTEAHEEKSNEHAHNIKRLKGLLALNKITPI